MKSLSLIAVILIISMSGCRFDFDGAGKVAVIDLDQIASTLGRDKVMNEAIRDYSNTQEVRLNELRDELRAMIEKQKKELGKTPKKDEQLALDELTLSSDVRLRQEITQAKEAADQLRIELVFDFKREVEPSARRVAKRKGMSVVMIKQNFMLSIDPPSDITNDVIDELQKIK